MVSDDVLYTSAHHGVPFWSKLFMQCTAFRSGLCMFCCACNLIVMAASRRVHGRVELRAHGLFGAAGGGAACHQGL